MYSSISFEKVTFRRPGKSNNFSSGFVQAIVFEVEDRELIGGSAYGGQRAICCTADLAKLGVLSVSFIQNEDVATLPLRSVEISRTGMYNLYFMICDPALRDVVVEGKTIWKNPGGYLPGRMAPLMNFYAFMSIAYVILGIFWFSQYARFWKEMAFWYFDYAEFNETGIRPRTFFLTSEVLELVENVGAVSDFSGKAILFLVLPVALVDAFFILWVFKSLSATLNKLQVPLPSMLIDICIFIFD
ncbi:hypothetical protein LINPERHAP1_LOCUS32087 [Linum perenne]